jgi:hypothetical protein
MPSNVPALLRCTRAYERGHITRVGKLSSPRGAKVKVRHLKGKSQGPIHNRTMSSVSGSGLNARTRLDRVFH